MPPGRHLDRFGGRFPGGSSAWIFQKGKKRPVQPRKQIRIHQSLTLVLLFLLRGARITHRRRRWGWSSSRSGWGPIKGWFYSWSLWWVFLRSISPLSLLSRVLSMGTCWSHPLMQSLPLLSLTLVLRVFPSCWTPGWWNLVNNSLFLCPGTFWSLGSRSWRMCLYMQGGWVNAIQTTQVLTTFTFKIQFTYPCRFSIHNGIVTPKDIGSACDSWHLPKNLCGVNITLKEL